MIELTNAKKAEFYKSLVTKNYTEAAAAIGLDRVYKSNDSLRSASYKLFKSLKPLEIGISQEVVDMVRQSLDARKISPQRQITEGAGATDILDPEDSRGLVIGGRNKAMMLLHKKMDMLGKSKKALEAVSISQLATTAGILFDKAQIMLGQATENIAVMAKVDPNMTPEMALDALLKMSEIQSSEKHDG